MSTRKTSFHAGWPRRFFIGLAVAIALPAYGQDTPADLAGTLRQIAEASDAPQKKALADELAAPLPEEQVLGEVRELTGFPATPEREVLLKALLEKLAASSPQEALEIAVELDAAKSRGLTRAGARVWAASDYRAVYEFSFRLSPTEVRETVGAAAVRAWSEVNPQEAFAMLAPLKLDAGGSYIGLAARQWALRDPDEASRALATISNPDVREAAAGRIFEVVAQKDPQKGVELLAQQKDPKLASPQAYALGTIFAKRSVAEAVQVLNQIKPPQAAYMFLYGVIHTLNKKDMTPLLENVPLIKSDEIRQSAAGSVARDLALRKPDQAIAWLPTLTDDKTRAQAYQGTGSGYADHDPAAAQRWLETLPTGEDRRYAIFGFAEQYAKTAPPVAADWAMKISENDVRERLLRGVLFNWCTLDEPAAKQWAQDTGNTAFLPAR